MKISLKVKTMTDNLILNQLSGLENVINIKIIISIIIITIIITIMLIMIMIMTIQNCSSSMDLRINQNVINIIIIAFIITTNIIIVNMLIMIMAMQNCSSSIDLRIPEERRWPIFLAARFVILIIYSNWKISTLAYFHGCQVCHFNHLFSLNDFNSCPFSWLPGLSF